MRICYIDEAGCTGALPSATSPIQPVFVLCGVVIAAEHIGGITREFVQLKRRYFPRLAPAGALPMHWILSEVKGSEIRKNAVDPSRNVRRHALGFLDRVVELLEKYNCLLKGRVWVKGIGQTFNGTSVYTYSIQYIYKWFNHCLQQDDDHGIVICDSRNKTLNSKVSFSVFTEKFKQSGDKHPRVLELPTFGHSENHAGVQIADIVCSSLLFPMAIDAYCLGHVTNTHVRAGYDALRRRYGQRLEQLQVRCPDPDPRRHPAPMAGGIMVADSIARRTREVMFTV